MENKSFNLDDSLDYVLKLGGGWENMREDVLEKIQMTSLYTEPTKSPHTNSTVLREMNELEKKIYTLMMEFKPKSEINYEKLNRVDDMDLKDRYITKPTFDKNSKFIGNIHILIDKNKSMRKSIQKLSDYYLSEWRLTFQYQWIFTQLLEISIRTSLPKLIHHRYGEKPHYAEGFTVKAVIDVCYPGVTWVTYAGEWQRC